MRATLFVLTCSLLLSPAAAVAQSASMSSNGVVTVTGTGSDDDIRIFTSSFQSWFGIRFYDLHVRFRSPSGRTIAMWRFDANDVRFIDVRAGEGADWIHNQTSFRSRLDGQGGDDVIWGGNADDTLIGGIGSDYMEGFDGRDILDAGPISFRGDLMYGGDHMDSYFYNWNDTIVDMEYANDPVYINALGANLKADNIIAGFYFIDEMIQSTIIRAEQRPWWYP